MSLLQDYARDFSSDIRKRGEAYQRDRAVQITDSGPGYVEAEVTGTDVYRVMVEHDPDEGAKYDCDCPYFADHGPCKHCWATVIEAFEQGVLPGSQPATGDGPEAARPEPRVVPVEAEGMDEEAADGDEHGDDADADAVPSPAGGLVAGQRQPTVEELRRMNPQQLVEAMRYKAPPRMFEDEDRRRNQPKNEDAWRNQLKRLSDAMAARPAVAPKPLAWPKGRRVVYVVDQRQTLENGLTLVPMQETPKRDGGYERARLLRISQYQVGQLPDPVDRHIIQLLTGTGRSGFGYYYDMPLAEAFDVDESATEDVLRQVCATGRCRLAPEGNDGPLIPVRWDDGPAWEFCLHLRPSPGGRYLILDGLLRRPRAAAAAPSEVIETSDDESDADEVDEVEQALAEARAAAAKEDAAPADATGGGAAGEGVAAPPAADVPADQPTQPATDPNEDFDTVPLSEPHLLLHGMVDGFVFLDGTVARLRHFDAFPLITALRGGEEIRVPLDKQTDLLKMLLKFPRLPRLQLPADLDIAEVAPVPRPKLKLSSPGRGGNLSGGRDALVAKLTFDYDGIQIDRNDPQAAVVTDDGRKLLRRDAQREAAYVAELPGLGFRDEGNYFNKTRELRLPANKLPKAVAELTRKGWSVEADGKLYRSAGQVTVSVSSGIDWFELHGTVSFDGMNASLPQLLSALRKGDGVVKLDDGTFGLLPEDWLKKYAGLAGLGETEGDTIKFSARQVGFLDALLSSMPEARFDEAFSRARDELMRFSGIEAIAPPATFQGTLRQYQSEGLGWMAFLRKFGFGGVLADDMGLGKAQPLDAKVLTPTGWKRMGDVAVGDDVINAQGGTSKVLGVYPQGEKDIYRVTFSDGSATECCDEHLWQVTTPVRRYRGSAPRVLPLSEIRNDLTESNGNRKHFVPMVAPVQFADRELPLHPYLLGVLLGDGGIAHRVVLSSADAEMVATTASLLPAGVTIEHSGFGVDYRIKSSGRGVRNAVADQLRGLGLFGCRSEAKFVPEAYKLASVGDRVEVLRGLLDTDGHVRPADNNVEFCTVSPRLAADVQFIVQSLGGTARIRTKPTAGQLAYRMSIALPAEIVPFRLKRKADVYHPREKYPPARAIASVEHIGRKAAQCIRVDAPDHLYVTDDFIVTHNTVQVLALLEARRRERTADRENAHGAAVGNGTTNGHAPTNGNAPSNATVGPATKRSGPTLVVAPRSLVFNWKSEAAKFAPDLRVLDHTAVDRVRSADHFQEYDLVITTYGTLRRDMSYFKDVRFDYAILDEAQAIKNAASESAKAARLIQADYRLCLSGTPVQNHLGELWSLFDFLNPGMMGSLGVFKELSADAANKDATARELLARALRPFILRRTKEQVAKDLPEKLEQTIVCELEKDQRKLYDELRDHYRTSLLERVAKEGMNKAKIMVLEALLRLRQAACHPGLIDKTRTGESSAKLETLMDHIAEIVDEGHKVLVFSQFTSLLAIVRERLDKQQAVYEYLDGRTKDRQARVDRFQTDAACKLFLISLKAGGVGLNLTAADYVFLLDPWWNPAVEAQAIDRAHRIGQTQRVFAYRLIAKDTVEEKVIQLQQTKKDLADAIINADNSLIRGLSREDLEMLLS